MALGGLAGVTSVELLSYMTSLRFLSPTWGEHTWTECGNLRAVCRTQVPNPESITFHSVRDDSQGLVPFTEISQDPQSYLENGSYAKRTSGTF